eukprot:GHRQ01027096.1.p2 GENE.GHRQ01027096.1~~GHRQ01027096.1.p2  ORF type:complete len:130 (+),score=34.64 GHRQ01027096.1:346-735(+)
MLHMSMRHCRDACVLPATDTSGVAICSRNALGMYWCRGLESDALFVACSLAFMSTEKLNIQPMSQLQTSPLPDNLNAELVLGSVSNVKEAVAWLAYTYLHVRMTKNPLVYGISYEQLLVSGGCWDLLSK